MKMFWVFILLGAIGVALLPKFTEWYHFLGNVIVMWSGIAWEKHSQKAYRGKL